MPNLLFISSSDYASLLEKGVDKMMLERSENGFFDRVISIHPLAKHSGVHRLAKGHRLFEFGFDYLSLGKKYKILRILFSPIYLIRAIFCTRKIISKFDIDIVRASDPYWGALVGWLATFNLKVCFVISIHADWDLRHTLDKKLGAPKLFGFRFLAVKLSHFLLRRADHHLCIRESLFKSVLDAGVKAEKISLFRHSIDMSPLISEKNNQELGFDLRNIFKTKQVIFFAGRISKENYIYDIIDLAATLSHRKDVIFVCAGSGTEEKKVKAILDASPELKQIIMFLGFIKREKVMKLRKFADVNLALMGGYSLIEACASGRAVIAYDVEWHSELIENEHSGFLVPPGNIAMLSDTVRLLLNDKQLAKNIGKAGQQRALQLHDEKQVSKEKQKIYRKILENYYAKT